MDHKVEVLVIELDRKRLGGSTASSSGGGSDDGSMSGDSAASMGLPCTDEYYTVSLKETGCQTEAFPSPTLHVDSEHGYLSYEEAIASYGGVQGETVRAEAEPSDGVSDAVGKKANFKAEAELSGGAGDAVDQGSTGTTSAGSTKKGKGCGAVPRLQGIDGLARGGVAVADVTGSEAVDAAALEAVATGLPRTAVEILYERRRR